LSATNARLTEDEAGGFLELPGELQLREHPVHAVGDLARFLEQEDLSPGVDLVGGRQDPAATGP
jgi:hypothetical protein